MKNNQNTLLKLLLCLACLSPSGTAYAAEPFAVVELFGSEGCSSCPPADDLLREWTQNSRAQHLKVYTLSFQVDYWNDLGWTDPYSKKEFTDRQYHYADVMQLRSVYTPQMIVNGLYAFVGSEASEAQKWISTVLKTPALHTLSVEIKAADPAQEGKIEVVYNASQMSDNAVLNFALVERGLESHITSGENAGQVLKHDNVVREFKTVPAAQNGSVVLSRPTGDDLQRFSVIAYLQNTETMAITAATSIDLQ